MVTPVKLKLLPRTTVTAKSVTRIVGQVTAGTGIDVTKTNGNYVVGISAGQFPSFTLPLDPGEILVADALNSVTGIPASSTVGQTLRVTGPNSYAWGSDLPSLIGAYTILSNNTAAVANGAANSMATVLQEFRPEWYGASGDGTTDDTTAFASMATAVRAAGGGTINLGLNKTYSVVPTPALGITTLMDLHGCEGLRINFNGSRIVSPGTFSGGRVVWTIFLQDCYDVEINGFYAEQTTTLSAGINDGLVGIYLQNTNRDIRVNGFYQKYGRATLECVRSSELTLINRTHGVTINGMTADNVYYGVAPQKNGDHITIRGLRGINNTRILFFYNIYDIDFELEATPGANTAQAVLWGVFTDHTESAFSNTTSGVTGRIISRDQAASCDAICAMIATQGTATTCAGFIRNVDIHEDIEITTAARTPVALKVLKQNSGGADTTTRGYVLENIKFSATLKGFANNIDIFQWGVTGTWTGETIRNIHFMDWTSTGSGTGKFSFDGTAHVSTVFDNIRLVHDFAWSAGVTGIQFGANVLFGNNAVFNQLVKKGGVGASRVSTSTSFAADNRLIRADGPDKDIQDSAITVDDSGVMSGASISGSTNTVTNLGTSTLSNDAVTYAKIQNVSATDRLLGRSTALAGDIEEIVCTAAARSILDDTTVAAIVQTLGALGNVKIQVFTSSTTYTPSAGLICAILGTIANGGGGAGCDGTVGTTQPGGGGGAGSLSLTIATAAAIGASQTVTFGATGTGGAAGANNGVAGGDVSIGTLCIAKGGSRGMFAQNGVQNGSSGVGGVAGTGTIAGTGAPGISAMGSFSAATGVYGGVGGSTILGGGGRGGLQSNGSAGTGYGSGGGGGSSFDATDFAGGNGALGIAFAIEFCNQ